MTAVGREDPFRLQIPARGTKGMEDGGLGSRSGVEKSRARFCSQLWRTHLVFAPAYLAGPPCPGLEEEALMRGSCGRAAGSHSFCFQHQRPEKRLSSPEGHGHPSWRLHRQEARSPWPAPVHSGSPNNPPPPHHHTHTPSWHNFLAAALEPTPPPSTLPPPPRFGSPLSDWINHMS